MSMNKKTEIKTMELRVVAFNFFTKKFLRETFESSWTAALNSSKNMFKEWPECAQIRIEKA